MRSAFLTTLIFTVLFSVSYWYTQSATVCPVPISYRLGDIDERFSLTEGEAKEVFLAAEAVWEEAASRELFVYDDNSTFAINFIYDERQQLASTEEEWRVSLDVKEAESKAVIDKVKEMAIKYESLQSRYNSERVAYEKRLNTYNEQVKTYNEQGGAPASDYAELQVEQKNLSEELRKLVAYENELSGAAEAINELGEKGNQLIEQYNVEVVQYNEVFGNRDLYTQGDFKRDRINIYKFSDKTELTKVIVHEFGHALGIGHVEGEESLMYYLMAEQPDSINASTMDKEALVAICGDGTGFSYEVRRIIRTALSYF